MKENILEKLIEEARLLGEWEVRLTLAYRGDNSTNAEKAYNMIVSRKKKIKKLKAEILK